MIEVHCACILQFVVMLESVKVSIKRQSFVFLSFLTETTNIGKLYGEGGIKMGVGREDKSIILPPTNRTAWQKGFLWSTVKAAEWLVRDLPNYTILQDGLVSRAFHVFNFSYKAVVNDGGSPWLWRDISKRDILFNGMYPLWTEINTTMIVLTDHILKYTNLCSAK